MGLDDLDAGALSAYSLKTLTSSSCQSSTKLQSGGLHMATVVLEGINKVYDNGYHAIHDLDLSIADKEFLVLVGPSGCGKSTALRMMAGLESITGGKLKIGDRLVNDVEPKDRDIAMVFQNYALYPHMSVYDNIGFALKLAKVP
ncbi:MAG: multiple sugar transport system ATP-binding protein, partial [Ilumatobacter sp.]